MGQVLAARDDRFWRREAGGEAEPLCERALVIREEKLGADHPLTASSLDNLARLYQSQGKYAEVKSLYRQALGSCEQQLGTEHPHTQMVRMNYEEL
jgi:tetratricopeptide (TPR) repeat protein